MSQFGTTMDFYLPDEDTKEPQATLASWHHVPHCGACGRAIQKDSTANMVKCGNKKCGALNRLV